MNGGRLRIGIVGGGVGREHALSFLALGDKFEVATCCDLILARARQMADELGIAGATDDFDAMLADESIDIIDICTWPDTHFELAARALKAGKHVVCEKPLAGSLAEIRELMALSATAQRSVMPIFQFRYGRGLARLKHVVARGIGGLPVSATIETSWHRGPSYYANPRRGRWETELGGICVSQSIHAHDVLTYIMGPIESVAAHTATRVTGIEVENCVVAALGLASGALANISANLGSPREISRYRFVFENLTAENSGLPYNPASEPWTIVPGTDDTARRISDAMRDFVEEPELYVGQFARLHAAMTAGGPMPVTLQDAYASAELISAIYHSARTKTFVSLPLAADHAMMAGWSPPAR